MNIKFELIDFSIEIVFYLDTQLLTLLMPLCLFRDPHLDFVV